MFDLSTSLLCACFEKLLPCGTGFCIGTWIGGAGLLTFTSPFPRKGRKYWQRKKSSRKQSSGTTPASQRLCSTLPRFNLLFTARQVPCHVGGHQSKSPRHRRMRIRLPILSRVHTRRSAAPNASRSGNISCRYAAIISSNPLTRASGRPKTE